MPPRMKMLGLRLTSANARERKFCPLPALNGLWKTPLTTKLCRMSKVDSDRSVSSLVGKGGAKAELKSVWSSMALLKV
jgi:hypothetical protein